MKYIFIIFRSSIVLLFIAHTLGLIARWYISGHAPWGDAYESMIYVAWATIGIGLLLSEIRFDTCINFLCYFNDFDDSTLELDGPINCEFSSCLK